MSRTYLLLFFVAYYTLSGCGKSATPDLEPTTCAPNQALVAVFDGVLQNVCGCQETAGTYGTLDSPLTCTVSAGTRVSFYFFNTQLAHQLISTENTAFQGCPVADPSSVAKISSFEVLFGSSGNYRFQDAFISNLRGQIIVQ